VIPRRVITSQPAQMATAAPVQITPIMKGFPELSKSGRSLSISDTNAERATNEIPSMPRKIPPSHFFEVRGFLPLPSPLRAAAAARPEPTGPRRRHGGHRVLPRNSHSSPDLGRVVSARRQESGRAALRRGFGVGESCCHRNLFGFGDRGTANRRHHNT